MKKVPEIISSKDLSYLEDMFNWHITACKKACFYSKNVTDEAISKHLEKVSKSHEDIANKIVNIIEKESN